MKHYFLNRNKAFVECKLESETPYKRHIKILEGVQKNKSIAVHPRGVSWGKTYPRLFETKNRPINPFIFGGRVLLQEAKGANSELIPDIDLGYRFQPFLCHVIDAINSSENVLLTGGTGVGKTTHILQLAARLNQPVLRANFNGETRLSDFIGKMSVIGGETKWVDGILPLALRKGLWLLLDELDFADPSILSLLHPVLEENPCLVLKENGGEVIKPHPNFKIFATANSIGAMTERAGSYSGTNQMNEAFLDRWFVIHVPNLPLKEEIRVIKEKVGGLKSSTTKRIVEFAHKVRNHEITDIEFGDNFSTRRVIAWAKKTALLGCPIDGARIAWLDKMTKSDHSVVLRILDTHFESKRSKKKKEGKAAVAFAAANNSKKNKPLTSTQAVKLIAKKLKLRK